MAISNVQPLINDEVIRTRIEHVSHDNEKKQGKKINSNEIHNRVNDESTLEIPNDGLDNREIHDAIDKLNQTAQIFNKRIKLSIHEESKRVVVKILDNETDKVIREIPAKEVLNFISKLHESIGILIDKKQ